MQTPFLDRYRQLIQIPTISSLDEKHDISNKALIELLAYWLNDLGFKTEVIAVEGSRNKYNLLATYGEGEGGLLLAGHTDTVPYDEGRWNFNPFQLTEKEGKFYGLGTADMKGFFAFVVDAVSQLDLTQLSKPLRILATADEETTMLGARTSPNTLIFVLIVPLSANRHPLNLFAPTKDIWEKRYVLSGNQVIPAIRTKALMRLKLCIKSQAV